MKATEEMRTAYFKRFGIFEPDEEVVRWWNSMQKQHPFSKEYQETIYGTPTINPRKSAIDDRMPDDAELTYGEVSSTREHNVGSSNYSNHKIQPWDIWLEYNLNPWDADIIKRVLRTKESDTRVMDYEKIIHICQERVRQLSISGYHE